MIARGNAIIPLTPAADHTDKEGYFVELSSGNAAIVNATTDIPLGVILEGRPTTGKDSIAISAGGLSGTVKVKVKGSSPGTIALGTLLQLHSDGTVLADAGTGARVLVAQALEAGAADELIEAVLFKPVVFAS